MGPFKPPPKSIYFQVPMFEWTFPYKNKLYLVPVLFGLVRSFERLVVILSKYRSRTPGRDDAPSVEATHVRFSPNMFYSFVNGDSYYYY